MSEVLPHLEITPQRPDWLAGVAGFELRYFIANYVFEMSHEFPAIQRNRGTRDFPRMSCEQQTHTRRGGWDVTAW
jgi:hypothetical protein